MNVAEPATPDIVPTVAATAAPPMTDTHNLTGTHLNFPSLYKILAFVLDAAASSRCVGTVMRILHEDDPDHPAAQLSHTTVRSLVQRIGLHEITRPRPAADDWIWLIDHTIQAGTMKCLVVLGIRQVDFLNLRRPLEHRDLDMLDLIPVETSNGEVVHRQLSALAARCGVPAAILSDRGSDLKKGVELLQRDHPRVVAVYDIVHKVSGLIGKQLKADPRWAEFRKRCCACANVVRQSGLAQLKPPTPKTKARDMNIEGEISWGVKALTMLRRVRADEVTDAQRAELPRPLMEDKLGWLDEFADDLARWRELRDVCGQTCSLVRRFGYDRDLPERLRGLPEGSTEAQALVREIHEFGAEMAAAVGSLGRVPGSSEVLESVIGKGKQLSGGSGWRGMTSQVLAMAAAVAVPTREFVTEALRVTGLKRLAAWSQKFLPVSLQSKRQRDLPTPAAEEQNLRKPILDAIPNS